VFSFEGFGVGHRQFRILQDDAQLESAAPRDRLVAHREAARDAAPSHRKTANVEDEDVPSDDRTRRKRKRSLEPLRSNKRAVGRRYKKGVAGAGATFDARGPPEGSVMAVKPVVCSSVRLGIANVSIRWQRQVQTVGREEAN
jgi:hypothetical protein